MKNQKKKSLKNPLQNQNKELFSQHLQELRSRVLWCVGTLLIGSFIGYFLREYILAILIKPLQQPVFYVSPTGGLDLVLQVSFFFGFLISLPVTTFHIIRFIEPALPKKLPKLVFSTLAGSVLLLIAGMSFAYFISLPAALFFLRTFSSNDIKELISTTSYFSFVSHYLVGFGLVFQLPVVVLAINSVYAIQLKSLLQFERWVIVGSFIIAAILTPTPDILNQVIMALPLFLLYQITILLIWIVNRRHAQS